MEVVVLIVLMWLIGGDNKAAPPGAPPPFPPPAPVPPPSPQQPPPQQAPPPAPALATYTIKAGDTPFMLAKRAVNDGSRWTELRPPNPSLKTVQTKDPDSGKVIATHLVPFNPGQVINLPAAWPAIT
jgi:nucleoid-associated protein YgaU